METDRKMQTAEKQATAAATRKAARDAERQNELSEDAAAQLQHERGEKQKLLVLLQHKGSEAEEAKLAVAAQQRRQSELEQCLAREVISLCSEKVSNRSICMVFYPYLNKLAFCMTKGTYWPE